MRTTSSVMAALGIVFAASVGPAMSFECPVMADLKLSPEATKAAESVAIGASLDQPEVLKPAIATLQKAGLSFGDIVNVLIAGYCPAIADVNLSDAEKSAKVSRFAEEVSKVASQALP